jgi:hypothetical protein
MTPGLKLGFVVVCAISRGVDVQIVYIASKCSHVCIYSSGSGYAIFLMVACGKGCYSEAHVMLLLLLKTVHATVAISPYLSWRLIPDSCDVNNPSSNQALL